MRVLVYIANYGTKNDEFLSRVLSEYRKMPYEMKIVVLSNLPKDLGPEVEVIVHRPTAHPWTFPFPHKAYFAERLERFDLFIYSEDDMLITERNIEAFLKVTRILPADKIAGFLRNETDSEGNAHCPEVHAEFHWEPTSLSVHGDFTFASFTNEHSACYVVTQDQLRRAIASGGFLVTPHEGRYDLLVSAATDPYTQCGMRKTICISHLDDFIVGHLPNKYVGKVGLRMSEVKVQLKALIEIAAHIRPSTQLIAGESKVPLARWSKSYYEPACADLLAAVPVSAREILSIGCGWGALEKVLVERGAHVVGIPLDSVIGAAAESRGVEIVPGTLESARTALKGRTFDCIVLSNIAHLVPDPVALLRSLREFGRRDCAFVVKVPNFRYLPTLSRRLQRKAGFGDLGNYAKTGIHATTRAVVGNWFRRAEIQQKKILWPRPFPSPAPLAAVESLSQEAGNVSFRLARPILARELIAVGQTTG